MFLKNTWISPSKIRLIKFKFKKAIVYCDENEPIYKIRIYKKKHPNNNEYNLEVPDLDLSEPLNYSSKLYLQVFKREKKYYI